MDELHVKDASEQEEQELFTPEVEGLTEDEARKFKEIFARFLVSYKQKAPDVSLEDWLTGQFQVEMPGIGQEEARKLSQETIASVETYDKDLADLRAAAEKGIGKEKWMADRLQEASTGMAVAEYGEWLSAVEGQLQIGNEAMRKATLRMDGEVSQALNLDGFIAEQAHVNRFNAMAALKGEPYRAEVCVPDGAYGKNSFDVVIKDTRSKKIVHQYQMKYGADAQTTIQMIKRGNYNNQILVVPVDQVAEVQAAFPGKTVVPVIGGKDIPVSSAELTKEEVKALQKEAQEKGLISSDSLWNTYNTKEKALYLGKNAAIAGLQGAVIGTGFSLAAKAFAGEEIEPDEVIQTALETGADAGIKSAAAGTLVVASSEGGPLCGIIPNGTTVGTIANIACVAVENIKILGKIAVGDLTLAEGLDQMGQTSTAMYCGLTCMAGGAATGAAALSWIPVVGPVVGGLAGGVLGYMGGSAFGETIYNGAKKMVKAGATLAKKAADGIRNVASGIKDFITDLWPF